MANNKQAAGQLGSQLGGQAGADAGAAAGGSVGGPVGALVGKQIGQKIGSKLGDKLGNKLGSKLDNMSLGPLANTMMTPLMSMMQTTGNMKPTMSPASILQPSAEQPDLTQGSSLKM